MEGAQESVSHSSPCCPVQTGTDPAGQEEQLWSTGTILGHPLSYSLSKQTVLHPNNLCVSLSATFYQER